MESDKQFLQRVFEHKQYDWDDEHFRDTPKRFVSMLRELTNHEPFNFTTFEATSDEMIIVKDIEFVSLCKHHVIPFMGVCHIGYVPHEKIAGLSKFARAVKNLSKDLTVQEDLTATIHNWLHEKLLPRGLAVIMEAEHQCMTIRGVQSPGTKTITSKMSGVFADHERLARSEFLGLVGKS